MDIYFFKILIIPYDIILCLSPIRVRIWLDYYIMAELFSPRVLYAIQYGLIF